MTTVCLIELANRPQLLDQHGPRLEKPMTEEFANRIKSWHRANDKGLLLHCDRYFAILSGLENEAQLKLAARKLVSFFNKPATIMGAPVKMNILIGFAFVTNLHEPRDLLIKKASQALRKARQTQAQYCVYTLEDQKTVVDEHALLTRLEEAIQVGEFRLFYQPKVHPIYKNVVGAEALIRWFRSDNKIIFPDQFIPVAEQNSIIRPMTWWVLKAAIARAANWKNDVGVAVNIPPNLLLDDELESVIADTLALYDFKPERLTVEVTEGVMVSDQRRMFKTLKRLRENGVRISIDDFGTGYSSMLYFRNLPADEVKLDRTFVMAMIDSKRDATLVKAMIELGHNFGLRVVAEGVENEAIVKALTDLRCDVLQGYHFDKPLPPDDFERRYCK